MNVRVKTGAPWHIASTPKCRLYENIKEYRGEISYNKRVIWRALAVKISV